jgi:bifunctional NMN adenylyltransferase/nudix hydrolase
MNTSKKRDVAVYIGRFQPFHLGHLALLRGALAAAAHVVIVVGSAFQARSPKNPFTWAERCEMIKLALSSDEQARLKFLPVRDYYDEEKWVRAVREGVARIASELNPGRRPEIALVGHFKDASSSYLQSFEGWELISMDRAGLVDATHIRDAYLGCGGHDLDAALASLVSAAPVATLEFLRAWSAQPFYALLAQEWEMLRQYKKAWAQAPYPPVFVTVDAVVRCADKVLLIKRGQAPGIGLHAVPGGFIEPRERAYQSAIRELREETGLNLLESTMKACLKASAVFDHPDRSQRGRTITHAFYFDLGHRDLPEVSAADDAQSAEWIGIEHLPALEEQFHDDHFHMLDHFLGVTLASEPNHQPDTTGRDAA